EPVPVTMPEGKWITQPEPIIGFTNDQLRTILEGTPRDPSAPRPIGMTGDPNGAFRFLTEVNKIGRFDPVAWHGYEAAGHLHQFHGNEIVGPNSDYASIRAAGAVTGQGGSLNRSLYWSPALTALRDGKRVVLRPIYCN